ncbi:MAG TPA: hypothetical protein VJ739_09710 [Gemmataceae bacterium]|nr:hypothetical protein [Gemmataceae bacterium]
MTTPAQSQPVPENVEYAAWRYWAALVRDREGPHRGVSEEAALSAGILARMLDVWEDCSRNGAGASNLTGSLEATIGILVSRILAAGVAPPSLPAGCRPQVVVRTYRETLRHLKETSLQAAKTWHELTPADRERLLSPVAFLASVARALTQAGGTEPALAPANREIRTS